MTAPVPIRRFPVSFPPPLRRGFGALPAADMPIANQAAAAASTTGQLAGALAGIPVVGAAVSALSSIGLVLANVFAGCGQTCVEATSLANQAEPNLQQNLEAYLAAPIHYASLQAAALNNFDLTWQALESACSNPSLGSAGQACISDRQAGSCAYKTSAGGWQQVNGVWQYQNPGANGSGPACWNWFVGYRDPIANDPIVVPDPVPGAASLNSLVSTLGLNPSSTLFGLPLPDLLAIGAALLIAAVVL